MSLQMRKSYSVEKKLSIINWHRENGSNLHKTSRQFAVDRKRIREWISGEQKLRVNDHGKLKKQRKLGSGRLPLSEELDDGLLEFLEIEREAGRAVSNKLLRSEALKIANALNLKNFIASEQFVKNWKRRNNITMRQGTNASQKQPEELHEPVMSFLDSVKEIRKENDYTLYNIGNMDQTMVRFDCPSGRTNDFRGKSTIRISNTGCTKRGFTVALAARASGHKMPAFCVFKEPSGRIPPKAFSNLRIPANVRVSATHSGWMTQEKFNEWVNRVWGGNEDDVRRLLVLDMASIHKSSQATNCLLSVDTDVVLIPGGCTSLLQPADVVWNKPFKGYIGEKWEAYMRTCEKNNNGNLKRPSRQHVLTWISEAWSAVSEEIVQTSFKHCGISSALDGSENGMFHDNLCRAVNPRGEEFENEFVDLLFNDELSDESFDRFTDSNSDELDE